MRVKQDVIIIGAGVIGLTTAALLKKTWPELRITVLEQALVGSGTSFYGGAADVPFASTPLHRELMALGAAVRARHPDLTPPGFALDTWWIAEESDLALLHQTIWPNDLQEVSAPQFDGFPLQLGSAQRAFLSRQGRVGSPRLACEALLKMLRGMPACRVLEGCAVQRLSPLNASGAAGALGMQVETACGQVFESTHVVLAVGPWLPQFADWLPAGTTVRSKKVIAFHLDMPLRTPSFNIQYYLPDMYFIPDPLYHDRWIFCICSQEWDCLPERSALHISAQELQLARALLAQAAPALLPQLQGARVFCDAYQSAGQTASQPCIGRHATAPGLLIAGAGSGSGYRLAPGIAQRVQQLIQETL